MMQIESYSQGVSSHEWLTERQCFSRLGFAYFMLVLMTLFAQLVFLYATAFIMPWMLAQSWYLAAASALPQYLVAMPVCAALLRQIPSEAPVSHSLGLKQFIGCAAAATTMMLAGSWLGSIMTSIMQLVLPMPDPTANFMDTSGTAATVLFVVICAPIFEELFFRKFIIDRVAQFGSGLAIVLSAAFFALFHGNLYQCFYAFGAGVIFGYLYLTTGRLRYSITLHMLINLFSGVLANELIQALDQANNTGAVLAYGLFGIYSIGMLAFAIAGLVILISSRKKIVLAQGACPLVRQHRVRTIVANAGMVLFLLSALGLFAMSAF